MNTEYKNNFFKQLESLFVSLFGEVLWYLGYCPGLCIRRS